MYSTFLDEIRTACGAQFCTDSAPAGSAVSFSKRSGKTVSFADGSRSERLPFTLSVSGSMNTGAAFAAIDRMTENARRSDMLIEPVSAVYTEKRSADGSFRACIEMEAERFVSGGTFGKAADIFSSRNFYAPYFIAADLSENRDIGTEDFTPIVTGMADLSAEYSCKAAERSFLDRGIRSYPMADGVRKGARYILTIAGTGCVTVRDLIGTARTGGTMRIMYASKDGSEREVSTCFLHLESTKVIEGMHCALHRIVLEKYI